MADNLDLSDPDHNKKLVKDSPLDRITGEPYPFIFGHQTTNGELHLKIQHPDFPKASCEETLKADGSYSHYEVSDKLKGLESILSHHTRGYNSGGHSSQVDGHKDSNHESTQRNNTAGDSGKETGGTKYDGSGEQTIIGSGLDYIRRLAKGAQNITLTDNASPGGDSISNYAGDTHENFEGDHIRSVNGNKYTMVKNGDYGAHVQDKNIDFQADSGKARIKTGSDILIESDSKITLKVGGSTIVITPNDITITSSGGVNIKASQDINVNTSKDIITKGSSTQIQGGGVLAPPTTFQ